MPTSFKGYGDDENGFYSVYRGVFANIAALEGQLDLPSFGTSESSDELVEEFYSFWRSFVTQRSFTWADKYNTLSAPQRRVKRLMEKENKKERDRRRRSFTELVRVSVNRVMRDECECQEMDHIKSDQRVRGK